MKSQKPALAISMALMCFLSFATDDFTCAQDDNSESWMGGIGSLEKDQLNWSTATLTLESDGLEVDGSDIEGRLTTSNEQNYRVTGIKEGSMVTLTLRRRRADRVFTGQIEDGVLAAKSDDGELPNQLMLRRVQPISSDRLHELTGIYQVGDSSRMSIRAQGQGLAMTDFRTGDVRTLYPVSEDHFVAGPAIAIPGPVEFDFQFQRDEKKAVSGVTVKRTGQDTTHAVRCNEIRIEEFVYESFDGTKIAGSLYRPAGEGPFPAIVCVHGSGRATRDGLGSWPWYYADIGFAVLAVDKRGMGKSEGKYELPDGSRDNFPHMRRRSKDVAAAVNALSERDDILNDRIGLSGASQAGWVIPMTVGQADVAFAIILSGGATPLSVEGRYSRIASENSSGSSLPTVDSLIEELRKYEPTDIGINKELIQMDFPCLWLYGYKDRSNPSQICEELINGIATDHKKNFTVMTFPDGNHGLLVCEFGGSAEYRSLARLVPNLYGTIENWLVSVEQMPGRE